MIIYFVIGRKSLLKLIDITFKHNCKRYFECEMFWKLEKRNFSGFNDCQEPN